MDLGKRLFRFQKYDLIKGVVVFWLVMLLVNIASILASLKISQDTILGPMIRNQGSISFAASNFFAVFIFFIIYGLEMYYAKFNLAMAFGSTRKDFYVNTIFNNLIVVIIFALMQAILLKAEFYIMSNIGLKPIIDYAWFNIIEDSIVRVTTVNALLFLLLASISNFFGVMQYRFSYKFWIGLGISLFFLQRTINLIGKITDAFINYQEALNYVGLTMPLIAVLMLIIVSFYIIGFLFIKGTNIK